MKKTRGHVLSFVLVIMIVFFSLITYHYASVKLRINQYQNVIQAYELSEIEMRCISYINYCINNHLSLESMKRDDHQIEFNMSQDSIECHLTWQGYKIHFMVFVNYEEKKIESIKFI